MNAFAEALQRRRLPHPFRRHSGDHRPAQDALRVMTVRVSNGLELAVVAIPGLGAMPAPGADEKETAGLVCVAATRATGKQLLSASGCLGFGGIWSGPPVVSEGAESQLVGYGGGMTGSG